MGKPETCRLVIKDDGPGILVIKMFLLIKSLTSLYPGSEIKGEPASEIRAIAELYWYFSIRFIIKFSL